MDQKCMHGTAITYIYADPKPKTVTTATNAVYHVSQRAEIKTKAVHGLVKILSVSDAAIFSITRIIEFGPHLRKHEKIYY
jgi:hypothetical protein